MNAHAKLSASGAHRWMSCPASISMEEGVPETVSQFAEEGNAAHELAERCLRDDVMADRFEGQTFNGFGVDSEMIEAVQIYLDYVRSLKGENWYEQRVDFSPWVPDGFGTCDALVLEGDTAHVIDLKYGKGVRVDAENNPQAMLYALGALNEYGFLFDEICTFKLAIVQPRLDHISEWEISREDLLAFGQYVSERADAALAEDAEATPSETACRFCKAQGVCRPLTEHSMQIAAQGFEDLSVPIEIKNTDTLTNDELAEILPQIKLLSGWIKAIEARAFAELERGNEVRGYKIVEGRSIRKWADENDTEAALRRAKLKVADIFTKKIISPAQAEKLLGKRHPLLTELVASSAGKPTLAPESDKRPALDINPAAGFEAVN